MAMDALRRWTFEHAEGTSWRSRVLNGLLQWRIPFNRPHGLKVETLSDTKVVVRIPYRRRNRNHLRGLHACVLAAGAEFASGVLLLRRVESGATRLIMKSLQVTYHYRGQEEAVATAHINPAEVRALIAGLETAESVLVPMVAEVHDRSGNHLATAHVEWQLKPWKRVSAP